MKSLPFTILFVSLVWLSSCSFADKNKMIPAQTWGVDICQQKEGGAVLTMRIRNLSLSDEFCPAMDEQGRFYGVIDVMSSSGRYKLIHRAKYEARVAGIAFSNQNPVLISGRESKLFTINLRSDYVSIRAPIDREKKWIGKAIANGVITMSNRSIYEDWWNELKGEREWIVNASFLYMQKARKNFALFGANYSSKECRSDDTKVKL